MVHIYNLSTEETEGEGSGCKADLGYIVSSCLKPTNKQTPGRVTALFNIEIVVISGFFAVGVAVSRKV